MYSVVVAAMLTTASATPAWWGCHGGCFGCHGCHGCYGGSSWGCHGCYGGCNGCYGGCNGCYGGCYGCYGGCYGCYGGCYGCYGGCYGCYGGTLVTAPVPAAPQVTVMAEDRAPSATATRATVVVRLPEDADLYVDGKRVNLTSDTRQFITPELTPGQDYSYTMKARAVRQGKPVAKTKRVIVRAGSESRVDFGDLADARAEVPAAAPAHITVRLPQDARLYIDGVVCPLTSSKRSFDSPALERGRSYFYDLKAEVVRAGKTRAVTKRVVMEAGKQVDVDFGDLNALRTAQR